MLRQTWTLAVFATAQIILSTAENHSKGQLSDIKRSTKWCPFEIKFFRHVLGNLNFQTKKESLNFNKKCKRYAASNTDSGRVHNSSKIDQKTIPGSTSRYRKENKKISDWPQNLCAQSRTTHLSNKKRITEFGHGSQKIRYHKYEPRQCSISSNNTQARNLFRVQLSSMKQRVKQPCIKLKICTHKLRNFIFQIKKEFLDFDKRRESYDVSNMDSDHVCNSTNFTKYSSESSPSPTCGPNYGVLNDIRLNWKFICIK